MINISSGTPTAGGAVMACRPEHPDKTCFQSQPTPPQAGGGGNECVSSNRKTEVQFLFFKLNP